MAKFRANTNDAYILTNIQNQESGDSDWAKYQVITKDKSRLFLHNNTTNSLLKVFKDTTQVHDIFGDGSAIATYTLDGNANDLGGNYNGTWSGTEQYDTGVFGQAAKFDSGCTIHIPFAIVGGTDVDITSSYTLCAWYKGDSMTVEPIIQFGGNGNNLAIGSISSGVARMHCEYNDTRKYVDSSTNVQDGNWHFICGVYDKVNDVIQIFVDGILEGNLSISGFTANNGHTEACIGSTTSGATAITSDQSSYSTDGIIDQVRIFNRALTEDEVDFLYHESFSHIRKHDQLIIYNATDGAKIHEVTSITDNDIDKTYDIDISSLSLTEAPTNTHQLTKSVDLTDKIDTLNTTATTLVLQDALENPTLVKNDETLVIDGYKLENINVTRSLRTGSVKYSVDISSLNLTLAPSEVILIKPRVEISVGDEDKANADDLVLDVDTNNTTATQIVTNYMSVNDNQRTRIKNIEKIDTNTGLDIQVTNVTEEGDGGSPEKFKYTIELAETQSSAPTKAIIRPTIQDILEIDPNNTAYDNTNDLVNVYYQPIQKGNGFRSVQVKWNAHIQGDENSSLRVNLWKKVA